MTNLTQKQTGPGFSTPQLVGGLFLIVMGIAFLFGNTFFGLLGRHVWLVFLAFPLAGVAVGAYQAYLDAGRRVTGEVLKRLAWGALPFVYVFWWVLGFDYALLWPLTIIFIGAMMAFGRRG